MMLLGWIVHEITRTVMFTFIEGLQPSSKPPSPCIWICAQMWPQLQTSMQTDKLKGTMAKPRHYCLPSASVFCVCAAACQGPSQQCWWHCWCWALPMPRTTRLESGSLVEQRKCSTSILRPVPAALAAISTFFCWAEHLLLVPGPTYALWLRQ